VCFFAALTVMPNTERSVRKLSEERPANKDKDKEKGKVKVRNGGSTEKDGASKSSSSKEDSSKKSKNKEDSSKKSKTDRAKDNGKVKKEEKVYRVSRAGTGSEIYSKRFSKYLALVSHFITL